MDLTYIIPGGDAGDPYGGWDRFGRTQDMLWKKSAATIEQILCGYNRGSQRTWREAPEAASDEDVAEYAYDGLSRRTTKTAGGKVTDYYYNRQWRPVEEREDSSSAPSCLYDWGIRYRDDLVRRVKWTGHGSSGSSSDNASGSGSSSGGVPVKLVHYALHDYYNVTAITDEHGAVVERYGYSGFGDVRFMTAGYADRGESAYEWDLLYKAQFRDGETGYYNYGFRYYVPLLGRWINRDPIGEEGGLNLYAFVENDPIDSNDQYGLAAIVGVVAIPGIGLIAGAAIGVGLLADLAIRGERSVLGQAASELADIIDGAANNAKERTKAAREAARKAAEVAKKASRISECLAIWAAYKAVEKGCRACNPCTDPITAALNCACWAAAVAGRKRYLDKKCDYYLPGSIARGSRAAEAGHKKQLGSASAALAKCCSIPLSPADPNFT